MRIASKVKYSGTVSISALNTEVVVVDVPPQTDDYLVEGWLDLSALQAGDTLTIREYVSPDGGTTYKLYREVTVDGPVDEPIVRAFTKTVPGEYAYRVAVVQTAGTGRSIPYAFIVQVLEVI